MDPFIRTTNKSFTTALYGYRMPEVRDDRDDWRERVRKSVLAARNNDDGRKMFYYKIKGFYQWKWCRYIKYLNTFILE